MEAATYVHYFAGSLFNISFNLSQICSCRCSKVAPLHSFAKNLSTTTSQEQPHTSTEVSSRDLNRRQNGKLLRLLHGEGNSDSKTLELLQNEGISDSRTSELLQNERISDLKSSECLEEGSVETQDKEKLKAILEDEDGKFVKPARFPGSVYGNVTQSAHEYFQEGKNRGGNEWEEQMLREALNIRRLRVRQLLKEAMTARKLTERYSDNLISHMQGFIDYIIIKAAAAKRDPEQAAASFTARAKSCIAQSDVASLVKWLKHNQFSYPRIGMLVSICAADLEGLKLRVRWLKSVHVKGRHVGKLLLGQKIVLERSIEEMDSLLELLENHGVLTDWIGSILTNCPKILSFTLEELKCRVDFFLKLGIDHKDFGTMVFQYPRALGRFSLITMSKKVTYLKEFGLKDEDVGRLLSLRPELLACDIESKWKPLVKYLFYLGIQRSGMKRILVTKPSIFLLDLENNISPKVRFLREIGIHDEAIGQVLVKFPALLTYSLDKKIQPVVKFLLECASVPDKDIGKVIALEPKLIGSRIKGKLEVTTKYFLAIGITPEMLGRMIVDFPSLLRYNLSIIRPKFRYLKRVMVRPLQDLVEFPRFFSYSLTQRIIPRHKILVENGVNFKLKQMLAPSDDEFAQRVNDALGLNKNVDVCAHDKMLQRDL